ncbi:MAG: DUF255 domain-containing protein, partial [Crocinitomicaceae bacterium]
TNNQQPTTNNQQPTTNNQQPTTNNQQPTTNNQQPTTNNQQPTTVPIRNLVKDRKSKTQSTTYIYQTPIMKLTHLTYSLTFLTVILSCTESSNENTQEENAQTNIIPVGYTDQELDWMSYTPEVFEKAENEQKLVLLEVGANWCHWCHVMDDSTYANVKVQNFLKKNFVLSREDQDSRSDLYAAYKPWGWPAIIVQNEKGEDLMRLKGYQHRKGFLKNLQAVLDNPTPLGEAERETKKEFSASAQLLADQFEARIDHKKGGYPWNNKFIQVPGILQGIKTYENPKMKAWTDKTIKASYNLVDPAWSGVYQYSAKKSWTNQHFEKLLKIQAEYIEAYALYAANTGDKIALEKAEGIVAYCVRFFGNESPLFYNSQNADLISGVHSEEYYQLSEKERLEQGVPSVDEHIYLKENCQMARSLLYLWAASDDEKYLEMSEQMLDEILMKYRTSSGLFMRELGVKNIFSFEDNRRLVELLIMHAQLKGNQSYLASAQSLSLEMYQQFKSENGMLSAVGDKSVLPTIVDHDNLSAAITYNFLYHVTGDKKIADISKEIYEKTDKAAQQEIMGRLPVLQMADEQLNTEPFHAVLLTDGTNSKLGKDFYKKLLLHPSQYIIFEYLQIREMTEEQQMMYGGLPAGTLFMCTSSYCSAPMYDVESLERFLASV